MKPVKTMVLFAGYGQTAFKIVCKELLFDENC